MPTFSSRGNIILFTVGGKKKGASIFLAGLQGKSGLSYTSWGSNTSGGRKEKQISSPAIKGFRLEFPKTKTRVANHGLEKKRRRKSSRFL